MAEARKTLAGNWGLAVVTYFVSTIISSVGGPIGLVVAGPIKVGTAIFSLNLSRNKKAETVQIFDGFKIIDKALVAFLVMILYIFLWSLLFIIPGIIAAISYSQTFYILAENNSLSGVQALEKSTAMMRGHKWQYFCLIWRFFGWFLLSILTLGIGFLFLIPYYQVSFAKFYDDLKRED